MKRLLLASAFLALAPAMGLAGWLYQTDTDKMTGKSVRIAYAQSENSMSLDFPYKGANYGNLQVRQHPKYGLDVIFFVDKGQLLCRSYDDQCGVLVRFDEAKPVRFSGLPSADHDSKVIFIQNAKVFIARAQKAKRILVQVPVYQNGDQVLEFVSVAPLEWTPAPAKRK